MSFSVTLGRFVRLKAAGTVRLKPDTTYVVSGFSRTDCFSRTDRLDRTHNVLLNNIVAAVIEMTEKIARYIRSPVIASKPVFFSRRLLKACTA